jgi:hypothetical protein
MTSYTVQAILLSWVFLTHCIVLYLEYETSLLAFNIYSSISSKFSSSSYQIVLDLVVFVALDHHMIHAHPHPTALLGRIKLLQIHSCFAQI